MVLVDADGDGGYVMYVGRKKRIDFTIDGSSDLILGSSFDRSSRSVASFIRLYKINSEVMGPLLVFPSTCFRFFIFHVSLHETYTHILLYFNIYYIVFLTISVHVQRWPTFVVPPYSFFSMCLLCFNFIFIYYFCNIEYLFLISTSHFVSYVRLISCVFNRQVYIYIFE